jgi:hypothetical protein
VSNPTLMKLAAYFIAAFLLAAALQWLAYWFWGWL